MSRLNGGPPRTTAALVSGVPTRLAQNWRPAFFASALLLTLGHAAQAQDVSLFWDTNSTTAGSGAATGIWGTNAFWNTDSSGVAAPGVTTTAATNDLFFSAGTTGTTGTVTVSGTVLANSITFQTIAEANTLTGGTAIDLGGGTNPSGLFVSSGVTAANSIATPIVFSGGTAETFQNAGTGVLTISGGVTGTANLVLNNNGATANGITISGTSLNNTGTVTNSGTGTGSVLISAGIGSSVGLITQSSTTSALVLSGTNTNTAGVTLTAGTLDINSATALGATASTLTITAGTIDNTATFTNQLLTNNNAQIWNGNFTFAGTNSLNMGTGNITINPTNLQITVNANTLTEAGSIGFTASNGITKAGAGNLTLSGTNMYLGTTTVSGGTLEFVNEASLYNNQQGFGFGGTWTGSFITVNSGTTLAFGVGGSGQFTAGDIQNLLSSSGLGGSSGGFLSGSSIGLDASGASGATFTYGNVISDTNSGANSLGLTAVAGKLILTAANTYTGRTTINSGSTLQIGSGSTTGSLGTGNVTTNGTLAFNLSSPTTTIANAINGTGGLTQAGSGVLLLSGFSSYSGATVISSGTVRATAVATPTVQNAGFEAPTVSDYQYTSTFTAGQQTSLVWTGNTQSVLAQTGAHTWAVPTLTGGGSQALGLQEAGAISQSLSLGAGIYTLSWQTNGRNGNQVNPFFVTLNGAHVGSSFSYNGSGTWQTFTSTLTIATAGTYAVGFVGTATTDLTAFLDNITLTGSGGTLSGNSQFQLTTPGASLDIDDVTQVIGSLSGVAGTTVTLGKGVLILGNDNTSPTYSGVISDAGGASSNTGGSLIKIGTGTQTLTGLNTYTGGTTISAGTLQIGNGTTTVNALPTTGAIIDNSVLAFNLGSGGNITVANTISGTGSVLKSVTGTTVNLTGTNSFTGIDDINAGVLNVASLSNYGVNSAIGARTAAQESATGDGIGLHIGVNNTGATLQYTGSTAQSTNRQIRISAANNTIDASGSVAAATLSFTYSAANLNFWDTGGTRTLTLTGSNTGNNLFAINIEDQGGSKTTLAKSGAGTWDVTNAFNSDADSGNEGYGGGTTMSAGTLGFESGAIGGGVIDFTGNTTIRWDNTNISGDVANTQDISSGTGGAVTRSIKIEDGITATFDVNGNAVTLGTALSTGASATGGLTVISTLGGGVLTLGGLNTYKGATTVSSGTLQAGIAQSGATGAFGNNSAVILANTAGVTLSLNGFSEQIGSLTGGGATGGNVTDGTSNTSATLTVGGDNTSPAAFAGVISDATGGGTGLTSLTKIGTGTLTFTGANTYTGLTTISAGTLQLGNGTTSNGSVVSNIVDNSALVFADPNSQSYAGAISGTGTLTKSAAGTLSLTGTSNTYSGVTTVSAGTLRLAASSANNIPNSASINLATSTTLDATSLTSSTLVLSAGQNLSGAGSVLGSVTASAGSSISPGVNTNLTSTFGGVGTLSIGTNVTLNSGSSLNLDLGSATANSDQLAVTGTLTLPSSGLLVNLADSKSFGTVNQITNATYTIATSSGLTNFNAADFTVRNSPVRGGTYTFSQSGNNVNLTIAGTTGYAAGVGSQAIIGTTGNLDALVGLNTNKTYVTAVNLGGPTLTINSVNFAANAAGEVGGTASGAGNFGTSWTITGLTNNFGGGGTAATFTGQLATLTNLFVYGANPGVLTESGLTPGQTYVLTFYNKGWDPVGNRIQNVTTSDGGAYSFDVDLAGSGGLAVSRYTFVATGTTETLTNTPQNGANTQHMYGFTTEQVFNNSWTGAGGGTWTTATWSGPTPTLAVYGSGANAILPAQASPMTINTDSGGDTVGHIQFDGTNSWLIGGTGTLTLQTDLTAAGGVSVLSTLVGTHTISAPLSLQNGVLKTGTGTLILSGAITNTGNNSLTISNGALQLTDGALNGVTYTGAVSDNSFLTVNNASSQAISGNISGAGALTKTGAGTLTLSGANSYSGGTTLSAGVGTLVFGSTTAIGTGPLTINGGGLDSSVASLVNAGNNAQNWNSDFTFVGTNSLSLGTGAVTLGASRQVTVSANTLTVGGVISGSGFSLTKLGAGGLTLSGASTYSGGTTLTAGTLTIGANSTPTSGTVTSGPVGTGAVTLNGGTLSINGQTLANNLVANASTTSSVIFGSSAGTLNGTLTGPTSSTVNFTTTSTVTTSIPVLPTVSSFNGTIGIDTSADPNGYFPEVVSGGAGAVWNVTGGGTGSASGSGSFLFSNQTSGSMGALTGNGRVGGANAGTNWSIGALNTNTVFSGVIINNFFGGTTAVTKVGTGSLTLLGPNAYTGATTVNSGTLALGNGGSFGATAVTVNLGGTLGVAENASSTSNAITGSISLAAGGNFSMADGFTSTLNVTGASTLAPASGFSPILTFDIGTGTASDLLADPPGAAAPWALPGRGSRLPLPRSLLWAPIP